MGKSVTSALAILGLALAAPSSAAAQTPVRDWPCEGCWVQPAVAVEDARRPAPPLLVLLHGDEGHPTKVFAAWRRTAANAQVVLFAPRCPPDGQGGRSWWRWNGDPEWLLGHTRSVAQRHRTDPRRVYLAGWSGGATYIGHRAAAWSDDFAAVSLAGGGAPAPAGDCPTCRYPVHHVMGDRNPLLSLATSATKHFRSCGQDVTWELLPRHSHSATWRTYTTPARLADLLSWLTQHSTANCGGTAPPPDGGDRSPAAAPSAAPSAGDAGPRPDARPRSEPALPTTQCSCAAPGARRRAPPWGALGLWLATALVRRRCGCRRGSGRRRALRAQYRC